MTLTEIAKYRFINQQIPETKFKSAVEMAEWFGAVQGQEYAQTKWGLGLRLSHLADADIEKDLTEGKILRTHLLRPTWHFVAAKDIRWMLQLTAPRVHAVNAFMYRQLGLEKRIFNRCNKIIEKTLQGGKQLTRDAINKEFLKKKIEAKGPYLSYIMMNAELEGIICSGAKKGNQFTYALLEERAPKVKAKSRDEALAELTKRYFSSRGPATVKDFSTWSGLTTAECRKGIEMVLPSFERKTVEGNEYYFPAIRLPIKKSDNAIYLLPTYDEYIMGYKDRKAIFQFKNSLVSLKTLYFDCTIAYDSQIIGTWKWPTANKSFHKEFEFFKPLNKNQKEAFDKAVQRLEVFTKH